MRAGSIHMLAVMAMLVLLMGICPSVSQGQAQKVITNKDVLGMVNFGMPDSAIIASINVGPVRFDVSPNALIDLRNRGVSADILRAMVKAGRSQPNISGSAVGATPGMPSTYAGGKPPVVPKPRVKPKPTPAQARAAFMKLKSAPRQVKTVKVSPPPHQSEVATLAALRQQKQAVQSGRVTTPTRVATGGQSILGTPGGNGTPGANPAGGPSNSNPNNPSGGQNAVGGLPSKPSIGASRPANMIALAPVPVRTAAPPRSSSPMGNMAVLSRNEINVDPCVNSNFGPIIKGLNSQGKPGPAVFTQDPAYNPLWIVGCHFGNVSGSAYLKTASGIKVTDLGIPIGGWSDTLIKVTVDPALVDVLDQDNLTLVIVPANGQPAQQSGFKFYAMRQEIHLSSIPQSQVSLANITDDGGQAVTPVYSSPYQGLGYSEAVQGLSESAQVTAPDKGMTAGTDRNTWYRFNAGTDVFNFNGLKPGFTVSRFQIDEQNIPFCYEPGNLIIAGETMYNDGSWNAQYDPSQNQIRVGFAEKHCHQTNGNDSSNSTYGLDVWVIGPALSTGKSPWKDGLN